jgi:hypothetical protein
MQERMQVFLYVLWQMDTACSVEPTSKQEEIPGRLGMSVQTLNQRTLCSPGRTTQCTKLVLAYSKVIPGICRHLACAYGVPARYIWTHLLQRSYEQNHAADEAQLAQSTPALAGRNTALCMYEVPDQKLRQQMRSPNKPGLCTDNTICWRSSLQGKP